MRASIKEKKEIAEGTLQVTYDLLGKQAKFKPGQYFFVTLINPPYLDNRGAMRHFSIVNSIANAPGSGEIVMATRIGESAFKRALLEVPEGTQVELGPIQGDFILPEKSDQPLVFIAGGIGITPFMSMIRYIDQNKLPYNITLIYSNRSQKSTAFLKDLQKISKDNPNIKVIFTMTDDDRWEGEKRRIDARFIQDHLDNINEYIYFVAGPKAMVEALVQALEEAGVNSKNIRKENFSGY